jgi:hypothetical protein
MVQVLSVCVESLRARTGTELWIEVFNGTKKTPFYELWALLHIPKQVYNFTNSPRFVPNICSFISDFGHY